MKRQAVNCIWVGIGISIQENKELYCIIKKLEKILAARYKIKISNDPHINLYDLSIPEENIENTVEKIKAIANIQKKFIVEIGKVNCFLFGLFFLEINENKELKNIHDKIVKEIVKLKGCCIDEDYLIPDRKYNERQKQLLMDFGNPYVLDQFKPHVTIGYVGNQKGKLREAELELNGLIGASKKLIVDNLHIVAGWGENKRTVAEFKLLD